MLPPMADRQLYGLMQRESRVWEARLERLEADLAELIRFVGRPGRVVVLDTSALMEGELFTEFDWHALDPSLRESAVRLVVSSLVAEELDDLKRHRDGRQTAQARRVLTTLWDLSCVARVRGSRPTIRFIEPVTLPDPAQRINGRPGCVTADRPGHPG